MSEPIKPILVSQPVARRVIGVGETKYYELRKSGVIETVLVGKRRMVVLASLERMAQSDQKAA